MEFDLKKSLKNAERVLRVASKPSTKEFFESSKITGLGMVVIGLIGFAIFLAFQLTGLFG